VIGHLNDIKDQPTAAPVAIAKRGANVTFDHSGECAPRARVRTEGSVTLVARV
jgi:hypothetical protein